MYAYLNESIKDICDYFLYFYKKNNFIPQKPLPLRINFDPSLSFVSCTICLYKKKYFDNEISNNYCVVQKCLRTNTYLLIHSDDELEYTSHMHILGGFCNSSKLKIVEDFSNLLTLQGSFLRKCVPDKKILITIPLSIQKYINRKAIISLDKLDIGINKLDYDDQNLIWKYGMDFTVGFGTRWEIVSDRRYNFGNVIIIKKENEFLGVEFGGTLEILYQAINNYDHKIFSSFYCNKTIFSVIKNNYLYNDIIKLFDSLATIIEIIFETNYLNNSSLSIYYVLEYYIRALKSLCILLNITSQLLSEYINTILESAVHWNSNKEEIKSFLYKIFLECYDINLIIANRECNSKFEKSYKKLTPLECRAIKYACKNGAKLNL